MRELILLRHGHSESLEMAGNEDIKRKLTDQGKKESLHAAKYLHKKGFIPEHVFSSPAARAKETAELITHAFSQTKLNFEIQPTIYMASPADLLTFIETWPDDWRKIILVGHNPGLSECADLLAKEELPHLTPGGICWLQWAAKNSWQNIANGIASKVTLVSSV